MDQGTAGVRENPIFENPFKQVSVELQMRQREPEQEAESRNGELEAVRNAGECESVWHGGCHRILVKNPGRVGDR